MLHKNKGTVTKIFLILSFFLNLVLIYLVFDNSITTSHLDASRRQNLREKEDSLELLNLTLKHISEPEFQKIKETFLENGKRLYKIEDEDYMVLGELCFKNKNIHNVLYCDDTYNSNKSK